MIDLPEGREMLWVGGFNKGSPKSLDHGIHPLLTPAIHQLLHNLIDIKHPMTLFLLNASDCCFVSVTSGKQQAVLTQHNQVMSGTCDISAYA